MPPEGTRVSEVQQSDEGNIDRISALPKEVLQHVLSFLPTEEAVKTCVLARPWRNLWKSLPVLRIITDGYLNPLDLEKLNRFVKYLLLMRNHSALNECEVKLSEFDRHYGDPYVDLLIRYALVRQAQIIRVELTSFNSIELDDMPFLSPHLTRLEFTHLLLPHDVLDFSSCPGLKKLWMRSCVISAVKISSESLEELTILYCMFDRHFRTQVSAPSLVRLELIMFEGLTPVLESMPSLKKAIIMSEGSMDVCGEEIFGGTCIAVSCLNCGTPSSHDFNRQSILLKGLSEAENLELRANPREFIFKRDLLWCPMFSKLKTLVLNEWCVAMDSRPLIRILQHTPVLEMLTLGGLSKAPDNWDDSERSYDPSEQILASKKMKLVKIRCEEIDRRVQNIISRVLIPNTGFEIETDILNVRWLFVPILGLF